QQPGQRRGPGAGEVAVPQQPQAAPVARRQPPPRPGLAAGHRAVWRGRGGIRVMDLLTQHEAFLRAIFDAPEDDTPRLVYADFLEENGEGNRAELIRLQCELAGRTKGGEIARDRLIELDLRQAELTRCLGMPEAYTDRGFETYDGVARIPADLLSKRQ